MNLDPGKIRILLVEDDAVDAMLVRRTLGLGADRMSHLVPDFELSYTEDLPSALDLLGSTDIDVVLLDLNLGKYRGLDTFFRVHALVPETPIVVLTGLADDEIALQAIRQGAQDYLIKEDLDFRQLGRAVRFALERQRVREAESRAERYLDTAAVMFLVIEPDGTLSLVNRCACEILGYREEEILGLNWFDKFVPEPRRTELRKVFVSLADREQGEKHYEYYENPVVTRTGETRLIAWHNRVLRDPRGNFLGVLASGDDVTEERSAEVSLRESQRRLSTLMANLPGMAYRCENDPQWTLMFVSEGARELTGFSPEELTGAGQPGFVDLIEPDDRPRVRQMVDEAVTAGAPFTMEYRLRTRDGQQRWVMESGRGGRDRSGQLYLEGIIIDVTARRRAEKALRRYTKRLETLQAIDKDILSAQSADAIAAVALNRIAQLVPDFCCGALFLFEQDPPRSFMLASTMEVAGFPSDYRFPVSDRETFEELQLGHTVRVDDLREKDALSPLLEALVAGGVRAFTAVPLLAEGELIGSLNLYRVRPGRLEADELAIARELADSVAIAIRQSRLFDQVQRYSRELEQRVAERTEELRETNAELEAFAFSVSHDLRNPLANIKGFSEALIDIYGEQFGPEGRDYLQAMAESAGSMDRLIEELLTYSRMSRTEIELRPIPLEPLVEAAVEREHWSNQPGSVEIQRPMPVVRGHNAILEQVIGNLIGNAMKYTRPDAVPEVRIYAEREHGRIRLWVQDNGIGIRPEDQERIFRVFERADGGHSGTGIGLATVRRGIERLGGKVGVESEPGVGSRFWFELPEAEV